MNTENSYHMKKSNFAFSSNMTLFFSSYSSSFFFNSLSSKNRKKNEYCHLFSISAKCGSTEYVDVIPDGFFLRCSMFRIVQTLDTIIWMFSFFDFSVAHWVFFLSNFPMSQFYFDNTLSFFVEVRDFYLFGSEWRFGFFSKFQITIFTPRNAYK